MFWLRNKKIIFSYALFILGPVTAVLYYQVQYGIDISILTIQDPNLVFVILPTRLISYQLVGEEPIHTLLNLTLTLY